MSDPPYSDGIMRPMRSSSAICFHSSGEKPVGSSSSARSESSDAYELHTPRTISRSISCSALRSRSTTSSVFRSCPMESRPPLVAPAGPRVVAVVHRQRDAGRAVGLHVVLDGEPHEHGGPTAARVVDLAVLDRALQHHGVAGEDRSLHAEPHAAEAAAGTRP